MDPKLLIIADLGLVKAFELDATPRGTPHLEPLHEVVLEAAHTRVVGKVTDLAGRRGAPTLRTWGAPLTDDHNLRLETRRRLVKGIAEEIQRLAEENRDLGVWMAAPKEVNHMILEALPKAVRQRVETSLSRDLTKASKEELLKYFAPPQPLSGVKASPRRNTKTASRATAQKT